MTDVKRHPVSIFRKNLVEKFLWVRAIVMYVETKRYNRYINNMVDATNYYVEDNYSKHGQMDMLKWKKNPYHTKNPITKFVEWVFLDKHDHPVRYNIEQSSGMRVSRD